MEFEQFELYAEELANSLTHGVGAVLFLVLGPLLISTAVQTKKAGKIIGACFFSFGLLSVYFSSTIFHSISHQFTKEVLQYFDLLSIYFLIAGTYTAYILVYFKNKLGFILLATIWVISALGINFEIFIPDLPPIYSLLLYLILGWIGIVLIKPSIHKVSNDVLGLILLGGVSYTIGTYFFYFDNLRFYHAIWHLFVVLGSLLHWVALFLAIRGDKKLEEVVD
jgi:hemolysin III